MQPDIDAFLYQLTSSGGLDLLALTTPLDFASGVVCGTNPPYSKDDFLAIYPKFTDLVPDAVMAMYIALASACLMEARWKASWKVAMGLFIAHYLTLYLQSEGDAGTTSGSVAASGLARGIAISQAVGDVSVSYQAIAGMDQWGAFGLTFYGQQLAAMSKVIGMGPVYFR